MGQDYVVEVKDLKKHYGEVKAVDGISFSVGKGEIFGVLGPNGAGKSTTMEIIVGLRDRKSGEVNVLGYDPEKDHKDVKSKIGVQLQTVSLFPRLTVKETLKLFCSFYSNPRDVNVLIDKFSLTEKKNTQVGKLSGGQAQRVGVALAMIGNAEIVFLDEPTSGLDPQARQNLWEAVRDLKREGKTVFITTHYMDEAQKLCDRIAIIDHGKIVAIGSPQELIDSHFDETSLEFEKPELKDNMELQKLPGVSRVNFYENSITVHSTDIVKTVASLLELTKSMGIQLDDFKVRQATLEDVFLKLTGRSIRE